MKAKRNFSEPEKGEKMASKLRVMSIMAHQDDFEFVAAGLFLKLRHYYQDQVELKILTTSTGVSGHHELDDDATRLRRDGEARASAAIVGAEYENLRQLDGTHVPAQVFCDRNMLGGLWNAIRAFAPDYIIAPPVVNDPRAGIHIDHEHTAEAVRLVAYQLGVPNAYPTMNAPRTQRVRVPMILNSFDGYSQEKFWDFAVETDDVLKDKFRMLECHQSQIAEWLPFVASLDSEDGRVPPWNPEVWRKQTLEGFYDNNQRFGFNDRQTREFFTITRWGKTAFSPTAAKAVLERDFPFITLFHEQ